MWRAEIITEARGTWKGKKKYGNHQQQEFKFTCPGDIQYALNNLCVAHPYGIRHTENSYVSCKFPEGYKREKNPLKIIV